MLTIREVVDSHIRWALSQNNYNLTKTGKMIGMSRANLYRKIIKFYGKKNKRELMAANEAAREAGAKP